MVDVIAALGREPIYEHLGFVDFRRRNYAGGAQRVIDGVVYGRGKDGVWTCSELGSREPIGPVWMLDLLTGATSVTAVARAASPEAGARSVEGLVRRLAAVLERRPDVPRDVVDELRRELDADDPTLTVVKEAA
jgi:hypothetical protein